MTTVLRLDPKRFLAPFSPPMGLVLFVAASISGERVEKIAIEMFPFLAIEVRGIFLNAFFPALSMTVPRLLGFA